MAQAHSQTSWRAWFAVSILGVGTFSIVTTELAPIGLLSAIATDFGQSEGRVGLIVTVYAWIAAVAALVSGVALGRVPRKRLLIVLMVVLALSSAVAAVTSTFPALLSARLIGALAHGVFWAVIGTFGAQLVPERHVGLATSIIFGGVSAASVLGVPLASFVGDISNWRTAFGVIAALSIVTAIAIMVAVPSVTAPAPVGGEALRAVAKDRTLLRIYGATACTITAHFAAFTYIEPFLSNALAVPTRAIGGLLLVFGVAGLVGNMVTGALIDRYLKPLLLASLVVMAVCLLVTAQLRTPVNWLVIAVPLAGWGIAVAAVFVGFQTWILREARDAALPASAIYVAVFNAAIGTGALVGSVILSFTSLLGLITIATLALFGSLIPVFVLTPPSATFTPWTRAD